MRGIASPKMPVCELLLKNNNIRCLPILRYNFSKFGFTYFNEM